MDGGYSSNSSAASTFKVASVGVLLSVLGASLLVWNESYTVQLLRTIYETESQVVTLEKNNDDSSSSLIDPNNRGKLVYLTGTLQPRDDGADSTLQDDLFGVSEPNAILLKRNVEVYQWEEDDHSINEYDTSWKANLLIDSSDYPDDKQNPTVFPFDLVTYATPLSIRGFQLNANLTKYVSWYTPIHAALDTHSIVDPDVQKRAQLVGDGFYFGSNAAYPKIGDSRVFFTAIYKDTVSLIAQQDEDDQLKDIRVVAPGKHSLSDLLRNHHRIPRVRNWWMRAIAWLLVSVGLFVSGAHLPGVLVEYQGLLPTVSLATLATATLCSLSWITYQPILSILVLVAVGGTTYKLKEHVEGGRSHYNYMPTLQEHFADLNQPRFMELNTV